MTHYQLLGVKESASPDEIRAAYDKQLEQHWVNEPESGQEAELERMAALQTAYEILSDPDERKRYDRRLRAGGKSQPESPRPDKEDASPKLEQGMNDLRRTRMIMILITGIMGLALLGIFLANTCFRRPFSDSTESTGSAETAADSRLPDTAEDRVYVDEAGNVYALEPDVRYVGIRTVTLGDEFTAEFIYSLWELGDRTEASLIAIMDEYAAGQGGGRLRLVKHGELAEEIEVWCFAEERKVADAVIIEHSDGYAVCYISMILQPQTDGG